MKPNRVRISVVSYSFILCLQAVEAAEVPKLFNNLALNTPAAWVGNVQPGPSDVALWNDQFASPVTVATALSPLGGDLSLSGIKVTNVGGTRNVANNFVGFQNPSSANILTLGAGGIDASTATQAFTIQSKVTIGADQTWNIGNANTVGAPVGLNNNEDLAIVAQAAAAPFNFGAHTVTTTGAGQITISSGYTLSNGNLIVGNNLTVIQGGGSRITTISPDLNLRVNSGTLRFQSNSGAGGVSFTSAAPISVNAGALELLTNNSGLSLLQSGPIALNQGSTFSTILTAGGITNATGPLTVAGSTTWLTSGGGSPAAGVLLSGNLSGSGAITYRNTGTGANGHIVLSGDNSGYTGSLTLNGASGNRRLRLAGVNSGSAAATWNVAAGNVLQVDGVAVSLGILNGAGSITNSSATTAATLNLGSGSFSGVISDGTLPTLVNKTGTGVLRLTGPDTYTGLTSVNAGKLVLSTSRSSSNSAISVADNATLSVVVAEADATLLTGPLTLGNSTLEIDFGILGNPNFAPISATNLNVNGTTKVQILGTKVTVGTFPIVQFSNVGGTSGIAGLSLQLPTRTQGTLSNAAGTVSATVTSTEQIRWNGNVSNTWDIDPDGTQTSGTANWITTVTNAPTRYLQGSAGTDVVTFDDAATGSGTVNLNTPVSPIGLTVNNTSKDYTFTGTGKISGSTGLLKSGTGTLTLANNAANDYQGGTVVTGGTLRLGDGVMTGAGIIAGPIANDGRLILNRPDNHTFSNVLSGSGTLEKAGTNVVTLETANLTSPVVISAGKLALTNGGTLSGIISGPGELEAAGGTVSIEGNDPNINTGLVTASSGVLRLNKPAGIAAVAGDVTVAGTATMAIIGNEQIPDTATLRILGSSADSLVGTTGTETIANVILSGSVPETQFVMRAFPVITGTATINQGILGVASANTATINAVVMTSPTAVLRVSGNTGASTLNVGIGGITASAGHVEVKFNTNDQDAILNLGGNVTTTADFSFTNAGYIGTFANVINLLDGVREFGITGTTTVDPDISGPGSLVKSGTGSLVLNANCAATHTGGTTINAGSLTVQGSLAGSIIVAPSGTLGGSGSLSGSTTVQGTLSPGNAIGRLTTTGPVTFGTGSTFAFGIGSWTGTTPGTDWDLLAAGTLSLTATPGSKLTIRISGSPAGFTESAKTLTIATSVNPISGFDPTAITIDSTGFTGGGTFSIQQNVNTLELVYAPGSGTPYSNWASLNGLTAANNAPNLDPDNDGMPNFLEFALNGNPLAGSTSGKIVGKTAAVGGETALTLTLPVRSSAAFAGTTEKTLAVDGLVYHVQGSDALLAWDLVITEVTGSDATAIQANLPQLQAGWVYRTFRSPGPIIGDPADFLRLKVDYGN